MPLAVDHALAGTAPWVAGVKPGSHNVSITAPPSPYTIVRVRRLRRSWSISSETVRALPNAAGSLAEPSVAAAVRWVEDVN